jgi:serine/threonine protein kinase
MWLYLQTAKDNHFQRIMTTAESENLHSASLIGLTLGDYQILRRLGRGGMSVVYLAEQQSLKRRVAFKVLKSNLAEQEPYVRRFHTEAQAAASLVHANIVQIYEVGNIQGIHYIAQEYVAGQNLAQFMLRNGNISSGLGVNILQQVAAALNRAGKQGIIHRDIKPENIMLAPTGEVKVADFGLARVVDQDNGVQTTQIGITMGTPLYMSPEQAEGKAVDPRSDMYSLGVTAYHMLTGDPPFQGETALSVAVQHLKREPTPIQEHRSDLSEAFSLIIMKLLAKDPADRFQKATDLQESLRKLPDTDMDNSWPDDLDRWDWENMSLANAQVQATQQLDALMKNHTQQSGQFALNRLWMLAAVIFFVAGMVLASLRYQETPLDSPIEHTNTIEKYDTVEQQYYYASILNTDEAYKFVEEYFPPQDSPNNNYYTLRAHQRLGDLHLTAGDFELAESYYLELVLLGPEKRHFRGFGLAGLANIYHRQNDLKKVVQELVSLSEIIDQIDLKVQMEIIDRLDEDLRKTFEEQRAFATYQ